MGIATEMIFQNTGLFSFFVYVLLLDLGAAVTVVKLGDTVEFNCWDINGESVQNPKFYIDLNFDHSTGNFEKVKSYQPSTGKYHEGSTQNRGRISFLNAGKIKLQDMQYSDEGTYQCKTLGFRVKLSIVNTKLVIYEVPQVTLISLKDSLMANEGKVGVSKCMAANGRPPAVVRWKSDSHLEFTQELSNYSAVPNTVTTVTSLLYIAPTKFYHNGLFICEVVHPAFDLSKREELYLNVSYSTEMPVIQVDDKLINLSCRADGNPTPTYSWTMPTNATFQTLHGATFPLVSVLDPEYASNTYVCTASNGIGQPVSASINNSAVLELFYKNLPKKQTAIGSIVGGIVGAVIFIGLVLGYFFYYKRIQNNKGRPKPSARSFLISVNPNKRPSNQYTDESLNMQRQPNPPDSLSDEKLDHEELGNTSESGDQRQGEHDINLKESESKSLVNSSYNVSFEIANKSSMDFRILNSHQGIGNCSECNNDDNCNCVSKY